MRFLANLINDFGQFLESRNWLVSANWAYGAACAFSPKWSAPWFNRGLMAKWKRNWPESLRFNLKATELDPQNQGAWWNLGIAATALKDWEMARTAWRGFGITLPDGSGPLEMNLGAIPVRIDPFGRAEVVWCERLDPARARIASVPLPESGHGFGDLLLTDGQPVGYRHTRGQRVPVFNEIERIEAGDWDTYGVNLTAPAEQDALALEELARSRKVSAEDWSTVRVLCKACSEGAPHDHEPEGENEPWNAARQFGIAAHAEVEVSTLLSDWQKGGSGRVLGKWERLQTRSGEPSNS